MGLAVCETWRAGWLRPPSARRAPLRYHAPRALCMSGGRCCSVWCCRESGGVLNNVASLMFQKIFTRSQKGAAYFLMRSQKGATHFCTRSQQVATYFCASHKKWPRTFAPGHNKRPRTFAPGHKKEPSTFSPGYKNEATHPSTIKGPRACAPGHNKGPRTAPGHKKTPRTFPPRHKRRPQSLPANDKEAAHFSHNQSGSLCSGQRCSLSDKRKSPTRKGKRRAKWKQVICVPEPNK